MKHRDGIIVKSIMTQREARMLAIRRASQMGVEVAFKGDAVYIVRGDSYVNTGINANSPACWHDVVLELDRRWNDDMQA